MTAPVAPRREGAGPRAVSPPPGAGESGPVNAALLKRCVWLTLGVGIVELGGGLFSGSLALLGDAGHMLTDGLGLLLAFLASWAVLRRRRRQAAHGKRVDPALALEAPERVEAAAALGNAVLLLALVAALAAEALGRLGEPAPIKALPALGIALLGLLVNLQVMRWLFQAAPTLNIRAALWHVLGDLLGSVAALASGLCAYAGLWPSADAVLALLIAALLLVSVVRLLRESLQVLLGRAA